MAKIFYFLGHEQFQPEVLVKHARLAEQAGFDGLSISEHFNPWVADVGSAGFAFSTLGAIAQATEKVELLTSVTTPLFRYHPAIVSQAAATIDRLSGGRFMLGVGTGESINETPLGYTFPGYQERAARMEEALTIMTSLLRGEKLTYTGTYYQTQHAQLYSPPVHPVPILLAAGGPKSGLLASRLADGMIVSVKQPEETQTTLIQPTLADLQRRGKQNFLLAASRWSIYAQSETEALQAIAAWRGLRAPGRDSATDPLALQQEADGLTRDAILGRYTVVKNAQEYLAAYAPLLTTNHADIVCLQTTGVDQEALIRWLGEQVVPELKKLAVRA